MKVKELYDHILKSMTAEEALMKILQGHMLTYEHLKFNEGEEIHPIMVASMAALDMGWSLAIPDGSDDEEVVGMMIGTEEYLEEQLDSGDEERLLEALDLLQYFVDRVEAGTIRSKTTYKKYKDFLDNINEEILERPEDDEGCSCGNGCSSSKCDKR